MKFLVVLSLVVAVALAGERREQLRTAFHECVSGESGGPNDPRKLVLQDDADVAKVGAAIFCINKKTGVQSENGDININVLKQDVSLWAKDDVKASEIVDECTKNKGADANETAFNVFKCLVKKNGK
ncbi:uncharacterized protein LOC114332973 [Diabrotica virgifera virgifera]|uniref:Uncharacterized protein n=1 Tax=Diabrotica virgifera virgifera TaxID=50390 RepID=A0ABM5IQ44_DIAVI|nr:uncharacterized protein LOC114332973 [Diabrotica virgifera virgifera]